MTRSKQKQGLILSATVALLGFGLAACGGAGGGAEPATSVGHLPRIEAKSDADLDSDTYPGEADDDSNHVFGHVASATDTRAAALLVRRYYAAAAGRDGVAACSLMYSVMAESVAEEYGGPSGPAYMHGGSCAAVMSHLFEHLHEQLSAEEATLKVGTVRVLGSHASVQLGFGGARPRYYIELRRERKAWTVDRPLGSEQAIYVE